MTLVIWLILQPAFHNPFIPESSVYYQFSQPSELLETESQSALGVFCRPSTIQTLFCLLSLCKIAFYHLQNTFNWLVADVKSAAVKSLKCDPTYKLTSSPVIVLHLYLHLNQPVSSTSRCLSSRAPAINMTSQGQRTDLSYRTACIRSPSPHPSHGGTVNAISTCTCGSNPQIMKLGVYIIVVGTSAHPSPC